MEKTIYEKPELIEIDSPLAVHGDSACTDGLSEKTGDACPSGADNEDDT
ncbi:MAG: hypothetical protein IJS15_12670 [Victivallales bacterium]|nr:hypothetical protein [Victivallales bacterium]